MFNGLYLGGADLAPRQVRFVFIGLIRVRSEQLLVANRSYVCSTL